MTNNFVPKSNKYVRIVEMKNGVPIRTNMVPYQQINSYSIPKYEDIYGSLSFYNQTHFNNFNKNKTVEGITGLQTDKIWFDLDNKGDLETCKVETLELVKRLKSKNITEDNLEIYFSGQKGFHIIAGLKKDIPTAKVKNFAVKFGAGLKSFDLKVYDEARILRLPFTKHSKSGLYKIPLTLQELNTLSIGEILEKAAKVESERPVRVVKDRILLTDEVLSSEEPKKEVIKPVINVDDTLMIGALDMTKRPQGWKDYKWAIAQGRFEMGSRHNAMMVLASTCKAHHYSREQAAGLMEAANSLHCKITGNSLDTDEIEKSLKSVYSDGWKGGQYTSENDSYLKQYCEEHGFQKEVILASTLTITEAIDSWRKFENVSDRFKVDTGIEVLNRRAKMTIGTLNSILAGPGVGKTSLALQILNTMSLKDHHSIFFSYDMYLSLIIRKLLQRHTSGDETEYNLKRDQYISAGNLEVNEILEKHYKNVSFCTQSGQTCNDIIDTLQRERERLGKDINLILIDYNELIKSEKADSTEATKDIAQQLRNIANIYNVCVIVLNQPNKMAGSPSDEITSYRSMKGSSMNEQSMDLILAMSRPGYDFNNIEDDQFMVINAVKNRHGSPFRVELVWDGYNGHISDKFTPEQRETLARLKERQKQAKENLPMSQKIFPGSGR